MHVHAVVALEQLAQSLRFLGMKFAQLGAVDVTHRARDLQR